MSTTGSTGRQPTDETTPQMIDWELALATARRLVRPGPPVSSVEARAAVAELRDLAGIAEGHVGEYTGLRAEGEPAPVRVVDRYGWVRANADAFDRLLSPLANKVRGRTQSDGLGFASSIGPRVTGLEAGALLAFLSGKVLGQFDPFWSDPARAALPGTSEAGGFSGAESFEPGGAGAHNGHPHSGTVAGRPAGGAAAGSAGAAADGTAGAAVDGAGDAGAGAEDRLGEQAGGRLLLVAPNIVHVERELEVDPRDFRLWVCLHEETHRVQFTAVPWLRSHLAGEIRGFLEQTDLDPSAMAAQVRSGLEQMVRAVRGERELSLIDLVQTPEQREILDRLTAVMSLLEGHADVVMDGVGPEVVPSVAAIRERFQRRRSGGGWFDQVLKRLLGLDAKLSQYRDGAAFVRHVVSQVGQDGFNQVWATAANLPSRSEIADPDAWVRRVITPA